MRNGLLAAALIMGVTATSSLAQPVAPAADPGSGAPPAPAATLIGPAMFVTNIDRALKFYVGGLGMKLAMTMGPDTRKEYILTFGGDPTKPEIILLHDAAADAPTEVLHHFGFDRLVLRIADLDALAARLDAAGIRHSDIRAVAQQYRMMTATDPDGYKLELVQASVKP
jgi:catechol 2,3-dioxygenase-like lactoylglutathione lyase family enzyme